MILPFTALRPDTLGIYPLIAGRPNRSPAGRVPARARCLAPDAAASWATLDKRIRVTDMRRTAEGSLQAVSSKRGTKPPGYSGHNFGLSVDLDVVDCLRALDLTKPELDEYMAVRGWFCHRRDGAHGPEEWHYNYFGIGAAGERYLAACSRDSTALGLERMLLDRFGAGFNLEADAACLLLAGAVPEHPAPAPDAVFGRAPSPAIAAFQRKWAIPATPGVMDARTLRTLAFVTAQIVMIEN